MSNALKKKPKKMQPKGFSKESVTEMRDNARRITSTQNVIDDSFQNVRLIAYLILHDKFNFGQKRLVKLENTVNTYLEAIASKELTIDHLQYYLEDKCKINTKDESNKIPFNERFALTKYKVSPRSRPAAGMYILAASHNYITLLGAALKSQFGFSAKQILEAYEWIRYYINTLSRYEQFDLKIEDIAMVLMEECKYCDERFVQELHKLHND